MKVKELPYFKPLLERVTRGDEVAFGEIYDTFAPALTKHIVSKIENPEIAQDILHDLFLSLWRNRENLGNIEHLPAYLYSSCRYLILAHYRKEIKQNNIIDIDDIDIIDEQFTLEDRLHYRYITDLVENSIENLPEKCKEVFKLSRNEYLSNKQIANKLSISESTVEKHINKAISKLKSVLKNNSLFF